MDDIERAARSMIRKACKKLGIKHRSRDGIVLTVCYMQTPTESVEFEGPVWFNYTPGELDIQITVVQNANVTDDIIPRALRFLLKMAVDTAIDGLSYGTTLGGRGQVVRNTIHLADPTCYDKIIALLDTNVPNEIRAPLLHKKLVVGYRSNNKTRAYRNLPFSCVVKKKESKIRKFLNSIFRNNDFLWEQALLRHGIDDKELNSVKETMEQLRNRSRDDVREDTQIIRRQRKC